MKLKEGTHLKMLSRKVVSPSESAESSYAKGLMKSIMLFLRYFEGSVNLKGAINRYLAVNRTLIKLVIVVSFLILPLYFESRMTIHPCLIKPGYHV